MSIDAQAALALELAPFTVAIERGRLRAFADAIGETSPVHRDPQAAHDAGHRDVLVPPTYFFSVDLEAPDPFGFLSELGVDMRTVLHGEQTFTYHQPVHAGDVIDVAQRIVSVDAKSPTMDFLVRRTEYRRSGELVAEADTLTIVRRQEAS